MIEFGVKTGPGGYSFDDLKKIWMEAERLGFDSAWLYDHLYSLSAREEACLESWTTLSALAMLTRRLRVGTLVLCNQFRHPSLLAKMASTLDVISNGRLELGIGAGWYSEEAEECGIEFPDVRTRILRLKESVQIIKLLWSAEKASFNGSYYSLRNATCNPKPVQNPPPPIWVGIIKGTNLMPKVAGSVADGVNLSFLPPDECRRRIDLVKAACIKAGRRPESIRFSWQGRILIAANKEELKRKIEAFAQRFRKDIGSFQRELESEGAVIGTPDECIAKLRSYVEVGIDHFPLIFLGDKALGPLQLFAAHVMPKFR